MEYKKDKRTKNLTLRDIHVGDWVQVWSETTERYSQPRKITQICDDGIVYLEGNEEGRPTLWVEDIKNVDALPITPELLQGFGFNIDWVSNGNMIGRILYGSVKIAELWRLGGILAIWFEDYHEYFNSFVHDAIACFPVLVELEWKGVQS